MKYQTMFDYFDANNFETVITSTTTTKENI